MAKYLGSVTRNASTDFANFKKIFDNFFNIAINMNSSGMEFYNMIDDHPKGIGIKIYNKNFNLTYNGSQIDTGIYGSDFDTNSIIKFYASNDMKYLIMDFTYTNDLDGYKKEIIINLEDDCAILTEGHKHMSAYTDYTSVSKEIKYFYFNKGESFTDRTFPTMVFKHPSFADVIPVLNEFTLDGEHSHMYYVSQGNCFHSSVTTNKGNYFILYSLAIKDN